MADASVPGTNRSPLSSRFKIDLKDEARRFFRQRFRVAGAGLILGLAFFAVGAFEAGLHVSGGLSLAYIVALLLMILGTAVAVVSVYTGLINPVTSIRGNAAGIVFDRRWGRPTLWKWTDADFRLDIDDRSIDPMASAEDQGRLFFEGPGGTYGNLTRASIGPLLDTARTYGALVSMKQLEQPERGGVRLVRRIRIRPPPIGQSRAA